MKEKHWVPKWGRYNVLSIPMCLGLSFFFMQTKKSLERCSKAQKIRATSFDTAHIKTSLFFSCAASILLIIKNVNYLEIKELLIFLIGVLIPSICSYRSDLIAARIGSRMKSIPSRLACLAAGTKSLSPETRII